MPLNKYLGLIYKQPSWAVDLKLLMLSYDRLVLVVMFSVLSSQFVEFSSSRGIESRGGATPLARPTFRVCQGSSDQNKPASPPFNNDKTAIYSTKNDYQQSITARHHCDAVTLRLYSFTIRKAARASKNRAHITFVYIPSRWPPDA